MRRIKLDWKGTELLHKGEVVGTVFGKNDWNANVSLPGRVMCIRGKDQQAFIADAAKRGVDIRV